MNCNQIIKKSGEMFLTLVATVLLSGTYFYWQPYDKCLFQAVMTVDKTTVLDFVTRLIYYAIFFSAIIFISCSLFKNGLDARTKEGKRVLIKLYSALFGVRILADIVIYLLNLIIGTGETEIFLIFMLLESLFDIAVVVIASRTVTSNTKSKLTKSRKIYLIIALILSVAAFAALSVVYNACKNVYQTNITIWEYNLYYCNMIRDALVLFAAIFVEYGLRKHKSDTKERPFKVLSRFFAKLFAVLLVCLIVNGVKFFILPQSMVKFIQSGDGTVVYIERITDYKDAYEENSFPF